MRWGGITLLLFLVWHLLNFTVGKVNVSGRRDRRPLQPAGRHLRRVVDDAHLPGRDGRARRCTCTTAPGARCQTLGLTNTAALARPRQGPRRPGRRGHRRRLLARPDLRPRRRHLEVRADTHDRHARHPTTASTSQPSEEPRTTPRGYYTPGDPIADTKAPAGPIDERWDTRKFEARLVNPANRRKLSVIIVGTGLAGGAAAATLGEAGYSVKSFCYQDSPRRAHSIAAQGGINAAKNYKERRRLGLPAVLRHRQGRRLPLPRVQRLPAGRGQRQHHRPVRRPGRARSPASTAACSTTAPSAACRCRAPSTPAARPASSC